jgi:hypothetical protein
MRVIIEESERTLEATDGVLSFSLFMSSWASGGVSFSSNFEKKSVGASFAGALVKYMLGS